MKQIYAAAALYLVGAAIPSYAEPPVGKKLAQIDSLAASKGFQRASSVLKRDFDRIVEDLIILTEIPAPPFKEEQRARAYLEMLRLHGLSDVEMDAEGNVMGLRKGSGTRPLLVIAAHLDTVFPEGTNVKVRRDADRLHAPGIADDTSSLSVLLAFVRAMDEAKIATRSDILFVGNVGEEGPGDLRGTRYLFTKGKYKDRIGQFVSFESGRGRITDRGVGSKRYKVSFKGPGGHSRRDFGIVNPAYAMADAIVAIGRIKVPAVPETVYNVGVVEGGTSVNSIPFEVAMSVDLRSEGVGELKTLEDTFLNLFGEAVVAENAIRSTSRGVISVEAQLIGDRPVGFTPVDSAIIKTAVSAMKISGVSPEFEQGSTDSNIPMSLGIPAVTLRSGFAADRIHSLDESLLLDKEGTAKHMAIGLLTVLALAGVDAR